MWRDQTGEKPDLVTLPYAENPRYCPVRLLDRWLELAQITTGPVFRGVHRHNTVLDGRLTPGAANTVVKDAVRATFYAEGLRDAEDDPALSEAVADYSAHSLRVGFVTYAKRYRGASTDLVQTQTRHRSADSVNTYTRIDDIWRHNAATNLGL